MTEISAGEEIRWKVAKAKITVLSWADVISAYAIWTLITFLTDVWGFSVTHAAGLFNLFYAMLYIMPLPIQYVVDSFTGNYHMLQLSGLASAVGFSVLTLSTPPLLGRATGTCSAYKSECIGLVQKILFYTSLPLMAVGIIGLVTSMLKFLREERPDNNIPPYEMAKGWRLIPNAAVFALVFVDSWAVKYGVSAILIVVSTLFFVTFPSEWRNRLKAQGIPVTREETKAILKVTLVCALFFLMGVVNAIGNTYFVLQASHLSTKLGSIRVPYALLLFLYNQVRSKFGAIKLRSCLRVTIALLVSMVLAIVCCIIAARIENRRLGVVKSHDLTEKPTKTIPMTIFWMVPQFVLLGCADGLYNRAIASLYLVALDFPYDEAPTMSADRQEVTRDLYQYSTLYNTAVTGVGVAISVLSVHVARKSSAKGGKTSWFQHTLNQSRLDNYYWTLAALLSANLLVFSGLAMYCFTAYGDANITKYFKIVREPSAGDEPLVDIVPDQEVQISVISDDHVVSSSQSKTQASSPVSSPQFKPRASSPVSSPQSKTHASSPVSSPQSKTQASSLVPSPQSKPQASSPVSSPQSKPQARSPVSAPQSKPPQPKTQASSPVSSPQSKTQASFLVPSPQSKTDGNSLESSR